MLCSFSVQLWLVQGSLWIRLLLHFSGLKLWTCDWRTAKGQEYHSNVRPRLLTATFSPTLGSYVHPGTVWTHLQQRCFCLNFSPVQPRHSYMFAEWTINSVSSEIQYGGRSRNQPTHHGNIPSRPYKIGKEPERPSDLQGKYQKVEAAECFRMERQLTDWGGALRRAP